MLVLKGLGVILGSRSGRAVLACVMLATAPVLHAEDQPATKTPDTPALHSHVRELIEEVSEASVELDLSVNRPKLIRGKLDIIRVSNSDPRIVKINKVGDRDIEVFGQQTGSSVVTLWMNDGKRGRLLQVNVNVKGEAGAEADNSSPEVEPRAASPRIKRVSGGNECVGSPPQSPSQSQQQSPPQFHPYDETVPADPGDTTSRTALDRNLSETFPRSRVRVFSAGNRLIVRGTVNSAQEARRILDFIRRQSGESDGDEAGSGRVVQTASVSRIVNLLKVPGDPQVRLRIQSVEIQREALKKFCQQFELRFEKQADAAWNAAGSAPATLALDTAAFFNHMRVLQGKSVVLIGDEPNQIVPSGSPVTLSVTTASGTPATAPRSLTSLRVDPSERQVPVMVPHLSESGRIQFEFTTQGTVRNRNGSESGDEREVVRSRGTELKSGQSLVISGLPFRAVSAEKALLLVVTPELRGEHEVTGGEPQLIPPMRDRGSRSSPFALTGATTQAATIEAEQRSGSFYLSGPSGYSD